MEYKPAEIIRHARAKAEMALQECLIGEVNRICDAFTFDTGLAVTCVHVQFVDFTTLKQPTVVSQITIEHAEV